MKINDFSKYLTSFFTSYLPHERGCSQNTIKAYRDTFVLFINYMNVTENVKVEKLELKIITRAHIVRFLDWLRVKRNASDNTWNLRLAAIQSYFKYVQYIEPRFIGEYQNIMSIRGKRNASRATINYLSIEGIKLILEQVNTSTRRGRRDLALLALMYDTGARVQEVIDLCPINLHLYKPYTVQLRGKGDKTRVVPLLDVQIDILKIYLSEQGLINIRMMSGPLFFNHRKEKLTRGGISYILEKYVRKARMINPELIPEKISCHSFRHSKAMHLLQAGVNLVYIRDILGHATIQTTNPKLKQILN
ncbi:MAG: site-specific integrase [Prevotella sp.]|jgi:site-specific recombinase XerD|nr:site-specific integrase [Prevotella sp.]